MDKFSTYFGLKLSFFILCIKNIEYHLTDYMLHSLYQEVVMPILPMYMMFIKKRGAEFIW